MKQKLMQFFMVFVCALLTAACGGGGGAGAPNTPTGSSTTPITQETPAATSTVSTSPGNGTETSASSLAGVTSTLPPAGGTQTVPIVITSTASGAVPLLAAGLVSDGVGGVTEVSTGFSVGSDGGGDGGSGDGGAGDGEAVNVTVDFKRLQGTWTVIASAYNIEGQTGTFRMQPDTTSGGYKFIGGRKPQDNLRFSKSGYVTGSLPLVISGEERQSKFIVLLKRAAGGQLADLAGVYNLAYVSQPPNVSATFESVAATMKVETDGSFRVCPFAVFSTTCGALNGHSPATGRLVPVVANGSQFAVNWNGSVEGTATLVISGQNKSLAWDFITRQRVGANSFIPTTGTRVAVSQNLNVSPASLAGTWDYISHSNPSTINIGSSIGTSVVDIAGSVAGGRTTISSGNSGNAIVIDSLNSVTGRCDSSGALNRLAAMPGGFGELLTQKVTPLAAESSAALSSVQLTTTQTSTVTSVYLPVNDDLMVAVSQIETAGGSPLLDGIEFTTSSFKYTGYSYHRKVRGTATPCNQLSSTVVGGTFTVVIDGKLVNLDELFNQTANQSASIPAIWPSIKLLPALCATQDRIYAPYTSTGRFNWSRCTSSEDSGLLRSSLDFGIYGVTRATIPFNSTGVPVTAAQGCSLASSVSQPNVLTVKVNGVIYGAKVDGDAADSTSFTISKALANPSNAVITINEPATVNKPATTITLEQSADGRSVRRVTVNSGGVTVGCLDSRVN